MKPFDPELFDKYDSSARKATAEFLRSKGYEVRDHPDKYAHDLIATKDGTKYLIECEVKGVWQTGAFQFSTIQIPARKLKFATEGAIHFVWRTDLKDALYFWCSILHELEPVIIPNRLMPEGELFFHVPVSATKRVHDSVQDTLQKK